MKQRLAFFAILVIPILSFGIAIFTLNHYGINWDEPYHYRRGQAFLQYLLTGKKTYDNIGKYPPLKGDSDNPDFRNGQQNFESSQKPQPISNFSFRRSFYQDDSWNGEFFIDEENSYGHPALNDVLAALSNKIFFQKLGILGDLESYHLFIIATVALLIFFIAIFMWKEFGIFESIFTSLTLATYPLLLAEQHFNIKDPIETTFYSLTIITAYLGITKNKFKWLLLSSLFFALGLSTKFNMVFLLVPLGLWFLFYLRTKKPKLDFKKIITVILISPILIFSILLLSYPTLWKNPVDGISQIIKFYLEVGYPKSTTQGYYYFGFLNLFPITWIIYSTPPIVLALVAISLLFFKKLIKKNSFVLLLLLWIAMTIGRNSLFGALSYGGVRIIMEYIPPLAMLAGIGAGMIVKSKKLLGVLIIIAFIPPVLKLIQIHPNENTYFNFLVGGLAGAKEKNVPYWGDSNGNAYYSGVLWLNQNAEPNARVTTPVANTSNIPRFKLRPDIAVSPYYWSGLNHSGEYLIELTSNYAAKNTFALKYLEEAMNPVYEVKVDGVAIAKVWKNDLAHVKPEFLKTKNTVGQITPDPKSKTLVVKLNKPSQIMRIQIQEPILNCQPLKTGFTETSLDGKSWTREVEDIAQNQLSRAELKKLAPTFEYWFMAKNAQFVRLNVDSEASCLLKAKSVVVSIL